MAQHTGSKRHLYNFYLFFFNEKEKEDLLWRVSGYFMSKPVAKIWNENFHQ